MNLNPFKLLNSAAADASRVLLRPGNETEPNTGGPNLWAKRREFFAKQRAEQEAQLIPPWQGIEAPMGGSRFLQGLVGTRDKNIRVVTADEAKLLRDVSTRYKLAHDKLVVRFTAKQQFIAESQRRAEAVRRGEEIAQGDLPLTRDEYASRIDLQRKLLKESVRLIAREALPALVAILRRLREIVEGAAREWEPVERVEAETMGLPFRPSFKLVCSDRMAWQIRLEADRLEKALALKPSVSFSQDPIRYLAGWGVDIERNPSS